jgi:hypothetical protein
MSSVTEGEDELCVTVPKLMLGYRGDTARTDAIFLPDLRVSFENRYLYRTYDI